MIYRKRKTVVVNVYNPEKQMIADTIAFQNENEQVATPAFTFQTVDGGILGFERQTGRYALLRNAATKSLHRQAPSSLQIGLLTPCNLDCHFCYRDKEAPSQLSRSFLESLLKKADDWGVLEVSFGGGEPLLFPGFLPMLETLRQRTRLGLNFTTNGLLLKKEVIEALAKLPGEIRISAYPNNRYRETLRRTRHLRTGLNLLVTPKNINRIELYIHDALQCGADNVLLLGYKGADSKLHLSEEERELLRRALTRMDGLPIRLGICLYPYFCDLPHLFSRPDCGAGDSFLVITPDKAVQHCSFSTKKRHFNTFSELQQIYAQMKEQKAVADIQGCTRSHFKAEPPQQLQRETVWFWEARASNNSNDFSMLARFHSPKQARESARLLQEFYKDLHTFFLQQNAANNLEDNSLWGAYRAFSIPPPVEKFVEKHHMVLFDDYEHGIMSQAKSPQIISIGQYLFIYHNYCLGLDTNFLSEFFDCFAMDSISVAMSDYPCTFIVTANGYHESVLTALEAFYHRQPSKQAYPPWLYGQSRKPLEAREWPFEQRSYISPHAFSFDPESSQLSKDGLSLSFKNCSTLLLLRLESWLLEHGYWNIHITAHPSDDIRWFPADIPSEDGI